MSESAHSKKPELKNISGASRDDLEKLVNRLVETGHVSAEVVNDALTSIRETTGERAKAVSETGTVKPERVLSPEQKELLLTTVKARFEENMGRHEGIEWAKVQAKLEENPEKMWSLNEMERTGGKPDVVGYDKETNKYIFNDCSAESPDGRRNICYDRAGQEEGKKVGYKPAGNAVDMAEAMGITMLTEAEYRELQKLGKFDLSTWSWLKTSDDIRKSGRALLGLRYFNVVSVNPNSAYNRVDRGAFRASLRV
jgi:hypothetical protein